MQDKAHFERIVKAIKRNGGAENPWAAAHAVMNKINAKRKEKSK